MDGLKRLLQSVGLGRFRTVVVQHHEHLNPGHHDHRSHNVHDHNSSHPHKHDHDHSVALVKFPKREENRDVSTGKKTENPDDHHNRYHKKTTVAVPPVVGSTAAYGLREKQPERLEQRRSAGEETTREAADGKTTVTKSQTRAAVARHDHDHDHDHDHVNRSLGGSEVRS